MGIIGTDVARETSGMILANDNFTSIINAIEEGRTVFINTKQTSFYLVITSAAEHVTLISTLSFGMPLPLLPTQILWLNLVTDGITGLALASEKSHHDVLKEPPRNKNENILTLEIVPFLFLMVGSMAILTVTFFYLNLPYGIERARTVAFATMSFTQLFNIFNMRSLRRSILEINMFGNKFVTGAFILSTIFAVIVLYVPFLQNIFGFTSIPLIELGYIFIVSSSVFWLGEGYKILRKSKLLSKQTVQ